MKRMKKEIPVKKAKTKAADVAKLVAEAKTFTTSDSATPPVVVKSDPKNTLEPLGPGQKYFEAPDGTILIGDASIDKMLYRAGNGGKGLWINPKR